MELLEPEANQSGESNSVIQQPLSIANDSRQSNLLKQMSKPSLTPLFALSQYQTLSVQAHLAPIFRLLGVEQDLMDFVAAFSLSSCDFFDSSSLKCFFLRTCKASSAVAPTQPQNTQLELFSGINLEDGESQRKHVLSRTKLKNSIRARISSGYFGSLGNWGMSVVGSSATETDGFPKTDPESSLWVITGNVQCPRIEPDRPTLQSCLDTGEKILDQKPGGERPLADICVMPDRLNREETPALTSPCGTHQFAFVGSPSNDWQATSESPALTSSGWLDSPSAETQKYVLRFAVMYRSATGDRLYTEKAPTLRSLANTGGKHQGGSGAWKVVEYRGEEYAVVVGLPDECSTLAATEAYIKSGDRPRRVKDGKPSLIPMGYRRQRPLSATEFERLMGWPVGCTEKGITRSGKEINISKTQRQKMLGNGIIPHEIQDICLSLKPFLESSYHQPEARSLRDG